jgi:phage host-nuclease inhibitor protein Gam
MALFGGRASMLEVQNRALIKTAQERAERIGKLERELRQAGREVERLKAEVERSKTERGAEVERSKTERGAEVERLKAEVERLKSERQFYCKRVVALEQHNHELTEAATKYSLWGQKLERELAKIDPDGAPARRFGARRDA